MSAVLVVFLLATGVSRAQTDVPSQAPASTTSEDSQATTSVGLAIRHIVSDQARFWTQPLRLHKTDLRWIVPFAGMTAGTIATDNVTSRELRRFHPHTSNTFSNYALVAGGGIVASSYLLGKMRHDDTLVETGLLGGEAAANALIATEVLKYAFRRQRPLPNGDSGAFFKGGGSFPSAHASLSWSIASVLAHEHPTPVWQIGSYGTAASISLARTFAGQHHASDVIVGALLGYAIGTQVYNTRHVKDDSYGTFVRSTKPEIVRPTSVMGSTYLSLDHWAYAALDRLMARGVVNGLTMGLRPWTRLACAEAIDEGLKSADFEGVDDESMQVLAALKDEFAYELREIQGDTADGQALIRLESVYSRTTAISGTPLNESSHLGKTFVNDFGRPYANGLNNVSGFVAYAESGRLSYMVQGEYQHSGTVQALPSALRESLANIDLIPSSAIGAQRAQVDQFRLLQAYAGMRVLGANITVGKQSLWWGPARGTALLLSNNAEPFYMLRIESPTAFRVPLLSWLLGPMRTDNFFGQLSGHSFPAHPYFYGQKLTFLPHPSVEIGISRTAVFGGDGHVPLTFHSFLHSFFSTGSVQTGEKFSRNDPGARHIGLDFTWRPSFARNHVALYADSVVHDDHTALAAPTHGAFTSGLLISRLPKASKFDLRLEATYTDPPNRPDAFRGRFLYWETVYKDAYLNKGNLMGSWVGREGKGYQAWLTYWRTPREYFELQYRKAKASPFIVPGGTTQDQIGVTGVMQLRKATELRGAVQLERWFIPAYSPTRHNDASVSIELRVYPSFKGMAVKDNSSRP